MLFVDRSDGLRIHRRPAFNAILPYLMRGRNEAAVYFSKDIDVENALRYVKRRNAEAGEGRFSLFGLVMAAALRTVAEKPALNRFVHRRALYQRRHIAFSFIVKKRLSEEAEEANAKVFLEATDRVDEAAAKINAAIEFARGEVSGPDDREVKFLHRVPGLKALVTGLFRALDRINIAPTWMIRNDPLFATAFFANLGSLGLDAPFHHLYEWGNASIFLVMGRIFESGGEGGARRRFVNVKISVDERVAEGIVFAHAASLFQRLLQKPELLESPPEACQKAGMA